ncbi:MAG TPA: carboxypeptidase regulatory-like domain-containing protein [Terriglobales bacterium]|nr:carboxypeptidase regulatory-like domain-containing protein [Terriglobales bacterium]
MNMIKFLQLRRSPSRTILACALILLYSLPVFAAQSSSTVQTQSSSGTLRIAGIIVNALGGNPLGRARVTIADARNPQNRQSVITSEDGRFEFKQSSPGKYSLQGAKRGFIPAAYDEHEGFSTAIVTGAGLDTEHLVLRLSPSAVLSGKILDESGEPVRHASVSLYREDRQVGVSRIIRFRMATTDDQGTYEFAQLNAGSYFISATAQPWYALHPRASYQSDAENLPTAVDQSLDVAYPVTYYGDSTEPDDATPIPIRGGDHLQADIHLNAVAALHLLFHAADNGEHVFNMPMLQKPSFDGMENVQTGGMQSVSPGVFEITGIAPGRYSVRDPSAGQGGEDNEINITTNGQELEAPTEQHAATVKATVQILGEATLPPQIEIGLRNSKMRVVAWQEMDKKGELEFVNLAPGKYDVLAGSRPKAYSVVQMSSDSGVIAGHTLNVTAGASMAVTLSLVGGTANVEGFAKRAGKATAGAMVVLVPKDPESNRELFRRDQSDQDGSFSLRSVIPGTYTIVAIDNGWDLDWSRPGVIAHYAKQAQIVTVSEHSQTSIHLADPVEVQPR